MKKPAKRKSVQWVRDGTLWGPNGTQIDIRNRRGSVWITVKADGEKCDETAEMLLRLLNEHGSRK